MPKQLNVTLSTELFKALKQFHTTATAGDVKGDAPTLKDLLSVVLQSHLIKAALCCKCARSALVDSQLELTQQMQKDCFGWCCATCAHWYQCSRNSYEGSWEIKPSLGDRARIFPRLSVEELVQQIKDP